MAAVGGRTNRETDDRPYRIAGNFIDLHITASGLGTNERTNAPTTAPKDNDGLCCRCRVVFGPRHLYAMMTTLWMTCNRLSRAIADAAAASFVQLVNRIRRRAGSGSGRHLTKCSCG